MKETRLLERIRLKNVGLRNKLLLAFVVVALLVAATGVVGVYGVTTVGASGDRILEEEVPIADASMEMSIAVEQERAALHAYLLGEEEAKGEFETAREDFDSWYAEMESNDELTQQQADQLASIKTLHDDAAEAAAASMAAKDAGETAAVTSNMEAYDAAADELIPTLAEFESQAATNMEEAKASADATQSQTRSILVGLAVLSFALAIGIGGFVSRRLNEPIAQLSTAAAAMSEGDLDTHIDEHVEDDEIGQMTTSFKRMQDILQDVFADIDTFSSNLATGDSDLRTTELRTEYPGTYGAIMADLNAGTDELTGSFAEIQQAGSYLESGTLDGEIDTDRPGEYGTILESFDQGMETLSDSFDQIMQASDGLKNGRLDHEFETNLAGDYGRVMRRLEAGFRDVNDSIGRVQHIADTVASTSEEVTASTEEIEDASHEVAQSVQEISRGSDEQSDNMQQAAGELSDLSATVEEIASSASQVEDNAGAAVEKGERGRENAADATGEISQIEDEAENAVEQVSSLDEEVKQIGAIVQMINDIAEQTNLLALNASIEAARAGEAGEGFAVVADEIKTLAGEAGDATADIETRIQAVQASTTETVDDIEAMKESVERGAETIEETIRMFDDIAAAIDDVDAGVKEISDATDDQAASTEEVVAMVDEVSSVAEETAAEASNVSAAAEEQTASLADAGENVENLSKIADELNELVAQFEVAHDAGATAATGASSKASTAADGGADVMEWQDDT